MELVRHRFCCAIINAHFGQTAEKLFEKLSNEGRQTLASILRPFSDKFVICKALKTLMQHQIVICIRKKNRKSESKHTLLGNSSDNNNNNGNTNDSTVKAKRNIKQKNRNSSVVYYYECDFAAIEMRLHFCHYLSILVKYDIDYCTNVFRYLLEHGRASIQQLFDFFARDCMSHIIQIRRFRNNAKLQFELNEKYCDWIKTVANDNSSHENGNHNHNRNDNNQNMIKSEIKKQFKIIWEFLKANHFIKECDNHHHNNTAEIDLEMENEMENDEENNIEQWTICHQTFLYELRNNVLLDYVSQLFNDNHCLLITDIILQSNLQHRRNNGDSFFDMIEIDADEDEDEEKDHYCNRTHNAFRNQYCIQASAAANKRKLDANDSGIAITHIESEFIKRSTAHHNDEQYKMMITRCLTLMCDSSDLINLAEIIPLLLVSSDQSRYAVNISKIIARIKMLDIQNLIHCRFDEISEVGGNDSNSNTSTNHNAITIQKYDVCRVFKIILDMKIIGDKQLAEIAMLNTKTVKAILYRLLSSKFVEMVNIPKSNDLDPNRTFFGWTINYKNVQKNVLTSMYNAVTNLMCKKRILRKQIEKIENEFGNINIAQNNQDNNIPIHVYQKWKRIAFATQKITNAIQAIDLQIALHRDF